MPAEILKNVSVQTNIDVWIIRIMIIMVMQVHQTMLPCDHLCAHPEAPEGQPFGTRHAKPSSQRPTSALAVSLASLSPSFFSLALRCFTSSRTLMSLRSISLNAESACHDHLLNA